MAKEWNVQAAQQFANVLARARGDARLTQRQLSGQCKVSHATVARLEAAKPTSVGGRPVRPSPDTIWELAKGLTSRPDGTQDSQARQHLCNELLMAARYPGTMNRYGTRARPPSADERKEIESAYLEERRELAQRCERLAALVRERDLTSELMDVIDGVIAGLIKSLELIDVDLHPATDQESTA